MFTTCDVLSSKKHAWRNIFEGNKRNTHKAMVEFMTTYAGYIYQPLAHFKVRLDPIRWTELKEICLCSNASAGGMDGWPPNEFKLLSNQAGILLTRLLNSIETERHGRVN